MSTPDTLQKAESIHKLNAAVLFGGNIPALALSSAIRSVGGFVGIYIPLYFVHIGGNPLTLGLLGSAASMIQFFALAIGGLIADYYSRRKVIVLAAFYAVFFPFLYAVVQDWRVFSVFTVLAIVGTVSNPAIHATVVDSLQSDRRTTGIAYLQVVSSLPMTVSPLIGGWLIENYGLENGFRIGCIYAAAFALLSAVVALVLLRETLQMKATGGADPRIRDAFAGLRKLSPSALPSCLRALIFSYALVMFANSAVAQYYILFASGVAGVSAFDWGLVASLQFVVASVLRIPGGWVSDRVGKRKIMVISLLTTTLTILLFALSRSFVQVLAAALLLIATGIYFAPAYEALQADFAPRSIRGRVTALWDMSSAVSAALGAFVGGLTYQVVGPAVPFYVFAVAELGAALLLIKMVKEPETKEF